jgi:hypothetical protein
MSDTPETDHAAFVLDDWRKSYDVVLVSFAEKLERERDTYYNELLTKSGLCNIQEQVIIDWKAEAEKWRAIANDNRN